MERVIFLIGPYRVATVFHKISRFISFEINYAKLVILSANPPLCLLFPERV